MNGKDRQLVGRAQLYRRPRHPYGDVHSPSEESSKGVLRKAALLGKKQTATGLHLFVLVWEVFCKLHKGVDTFVGFCTVCETVLRAVCFMLFFFCIFKSFRRFLYRAANRWLITLRKHIKHTIKYIKRVLLTTHTCDRRVLTMHAIISPWYRSWMWLYNTHRIREEYFMNHFNVSSNIQLLLITNKTKCMNVMHIRFNYHHNLTNFLFYSHSLFNYPSFFNSHSLLISHSLLKSHSFMNVYSFFDLFVF